MAFHSNRAKAVVIASLLGLAGVTALTAFPALSGVELASNGTPLPAPVIDSPKPANAGLETAVLSGGCFWGVQGVFEHVRGIRKVVAGYAGGRQATASYEMVSTGLTGHAESVQITFDPRQISYG